MVSFDFNISLGILIQTGVVVGGGLVALGVMRNTLTTVKEELASSKEETGKEISGIQTEIKKIGELLTAQAVSDVRIESLTARQDRLERELYDLRRGEGWVAGNRRGIDGEYGSS